MQCVIFVLTDKAQIQWQTTKRMIGVDAKLMTWEEFKECFYEKYFSTNLRHLKETNFWAQSRATCLQRSMIKSSSSCSILPIPWLPRRQKEQRDSSKGFKPTTQAEAFCLASQLDSSLEAEQLNSLGMGSSSGQKRKTDQRAPKPQQKSQNSDRS